VDALVAALRELDEQTEVDGEDGEERGEKLREAFPRTGEEVRVLLS
jgi:hypothetical protein